MQYYCLSYTTFEIPFSPLSQLDKIPLNQLLMQPDDTTLMPEEKDPLLATRDEMLTNNTPTGETEDKGHVSSQPYLNETLPFTPNVTINEEHDNIDRDVDPTNEERHTTELKLELKIENCTEKDARPNSMIQSQVIQ